MNTDTYPYRYNFDAHMIQRANARGSRRYIARVDFGHGPETVKLATFTVVPA